MSGLITGLTPIGSVDRAVDLLEIVDVSLNASRSITPNNLVGISGGSVLSTTDTQSVANKTLDNTNTIVIKDSLFTLQDNGDATKQAQFQLSGLTTGQTRVYTLPDATGTLMDLASVQSGSNKTFVNPVLTLPTITDLSHAQHDHSSAAEGGLIAGGGGGAILLQTDSVDNGSQVKLNLVGGTGVSLTDNTTGTITIDSSGGITLETDGSMNGDQTFLNLTSGTGISLGESSGVVTITSTAESVLQQKSVIEVTTLSGTTAIPADNTFPQKTEGDQYLSLTFSPARTASTIRIEVQAMLSTTAATDIITGALFLPSFNDAIAAVPVTTTTANQLVQLSIVAFLTLGSTSSTTVTFRAGTSNSGTIRLNGKSGGLILGGSISSYISMVEYSTDIST